METAIKKFKECPFCGGKARVGEAFMDGKDIYILGCSNDDCPCSHLIFTVLEWESRQ
jgi:hypothetical protein